jgi:tetratricopeptide (TPR) repeat protein
MAGPAPSNSFVGRERELAELGGALDDADTGRGRLFLLSGEPGIGKTRLAEEIATEASARGMRVAWGRCWEGSGAPAYWPWVRILRTLIIEPNRAPGRAPIVPPDIGHLLPELASEIRGPRPSDPQQARFQLFDAVATLLKELGHARPLILILDDIHAADQSSLSMLHFVARELRDARIAILATYRDNEIEGAPSLSSIVTGLNREGRRLPLGGLTDSEVASFAKARAGVALDAGLVAAIVRATSGNPLFLDGVLSTMIANGKFDGSRLLRASDVRLPDAVEITIREQIDRLPASARPLLEVASALGNEFEYETLKTALKIVAEQFDAELGGLISTGIVLKGPGSSYRFAHALIRDAIHEQVAPRERTRIHRRIAEALEELHSAEAEAHLDELAHHFGQAVGPETVERAIYYSLRASQAAYDQHEFDRSRFYGRAALGMMSSATPNPARRAKLLTGLAEEMLSSTPEAISYLEAALPLFESIDDYKQIAAIHIRLGTLLSEGQRGCLDLPRAIDHFDRAEGLLTRHPDPANLMQLFHHRGVVCLLTMETKKGLDLTLRAMELCEQLGDELWWTLTSAVRIRFLVWFGRLAEARSLELRAREKADRLDDASTGPLIAYHAGVSYSELWDARVALLGCLAELSKSHTSRSPFRTMLLGESSYLFMRVGEIAETRRVLTQMRGPDASTALPWEDGDWDRNHQDMTNQVELARRDGNLELMCVRLHWLGQICKVRGMYAQSEAFSRESLALAQKAPNLPRILQVEQDLCLVYFDLRRREDAKQSLEACLRILALGEDWRGLEGGVVRAQAVVAALNRRFTEADTQFGKALDIVRRYSEPWLEAHVYLYWARTLALAGDKRRANEKFQAQIEIYRRIGAGQPWIDNVTAEMERGSHQPAASPIAVAVNQKTLCTFRREGEYWALSYQGEIFRVRDANGLHYIAHLLGLPGQQVSSLELAALTSGGETANDANNSDAMASGHITSDLGDAGEMLDSKSIAQYKRRRDELREELDLAVRANDVGAQQRSRAELDALAHQLISGRGKGGQLRKVAAHRERARVAVTKRIKSALENIRAADPSMGRHLATSIQTGHCCCYTPSRPVSWQL